MSAGLPTAYPAEAEADVVLTDGGTVHIRPIRPDDAAPLEDLHSRLSAETVYLRFFSPLPRLSPQMVERFTTVDYFDRYALVAELGDQLVAVARYDRVPGTREAEVAFVVEDRHQGRGLGMILLEHLVAAARIRGIERFFAETLPGNSRMLGVFRDAGFEESSTFDGQVVNVSFAIEPTPASLAASHERERRAAARSVQRLLAPRSIAVIGASRQPATIGHEVLMNLLRDGFNGPVYPVHPTAHQVASIRAFPSVLDIPDEVDLAIVVVAAEQVPDVVEQCGRKQVGGLIVISAGFADAGPEGAAAERRVVEQARGWGMRLIGPNTMGVVNTAPAVSMNATFAPVRSVAGRVGFSSQSGALGVTILDELNHRGLGVSTFVSLGNKADVSSNDLLQYWQDDSETDVVLLYLERFGNPRTFARVARRLSRSKPIVAVRSARRSGSGTAVDALFRQTGVIRVDSLDELFAVAQLLVHQPLPAGRRVAIVGNADGPAMLAADACEGHGLELPAFTPATMDELRSLLPASREPGNPLNLGPNATAADYQRALTVALADPGVDAAIVVFMPPLVVQAEAVAAAIRTAAATAPGKPVTANFLARQGVGDEPPAGPAIPSYRYPEAAALALARVAEYAAWRDRPEGTVPAFDRMDTDAARRLVERALAKAPGGARLDQRDTAALLRAYGVSVAVRTTALPGTVETVVRLEQDPSFGPVLTFGVAGFGGNPVGRAAFELLGQPSSRVLPLTDLDAAELVRSVRGAPLLFGHRGSPAVDVAALEELLLRVAALAEDVPELAELELFPVTVGPQGVTVAEASGRVAPWHPRPEMAVRRLR